MTNLSEIVARVNRVLNYHQSQCDGWQLILTSTGEVTLTAPNGRTVKVPSINELKSIASKLPTPEQLGYKSHIGKDSGWRITPDNFMHQWGYGITDNAGIAKVNYPVAYPSVPLIVRVFDTSGSPDGVNPMGFLRENLTTTSLTVLSSDTKHGRMTGFFWEAWGKVK